MPSTQDFPLRVETSGMQTLCSLPMASIPSAGDIETGIYIYICTPCASPPSPMVAESGPEMAARTASDSPSVVHPALLWSIALTVLLHCVFVMH